jgi:hypothetical protein
MYFNLTALFKSNSSGLCLLQINKNIIYMTDNKDNAITCVRCIRHANNGPCHMVYFCLQYDSILST